MTCIWDQPIWYAFYEYIISRIEKFSEWNDITERSKHSSFHYQTRSHNAGRFLSWNIWVLSFMGGKKCTVHIYMLYNKHKPISVVLDLSPSRHNINSLALRTAFRPSEDLNIYIYIYLWEDWSMILKTENISSWCNIHLRVQIYVRISFFTEWKMLVKLWHPNTEKYFTG